MNFNISNKQLTIIRLLLTLAIAVLLFQVIYKKFTTPAYFHQFNQLSENSKNITGVSLVNLPSNEEKEIQETVKKVFEEQWNYYYDKDENKLDESIKNFYLLDEYLLFKKEIKEEVKDNQSEYEYINFTKKDVPSFVKNIKFSKFRKYKNFNDRIGVIAGFSGRNKLSMQYFLFKKVNNKWKIEKERITYTSPYELPNVETLIIQELLEQKNNEEIEHVKENIISK